MVDMVVHRHELRATLANLCRLLTKAPAAPSRDRRAGGKRPPSSGSVCPRRRADQQFRCIRAMPDDRRNSIR